MNERIFKNLTLILLFLSNLLFFKFYSAMKMQKICSPSSKVSRLLACVIAATSAIWVSCNRNSEVQISAADDAHNGLSSITILTWDEYFSMDLIRDFEREHKVNVDFVHFTNVDEMEELMRSRPSDFDLVLTTNGKVADLIATQLVQPIEKDRIPLASNLDKRFLDLGSDPGNRFSVPYMWGPTLIAYRSDKIADPAKSWASLWDDRYKGHVLLLDEPFDTYAAALMTLGYDINTQDSDELEKASQRLTQHVRDFDSRFVDIFEVRDRLLSGDCWITMTYSSDAAVLAEKEPNISYFVPEEGASLWLDCFVVPREAKNPEMAHAFLDFFCRPDVAAANSSELWCASANREARALVSQEVLEDPTIYLSEEVLARCQFERQSSPSRQMAVNQGFKRIFDEIRQAEASKQRAVAMPAESIAEP
ncbi:MAG: spermidine/putrescine ABC transporter substrate-binding protein [Verrucomicrobiales bacterium]|nr:spermidine/putrescine ABC transporter substrate-binding protein [Verrucomicrobiales bacterium]